MTKNLLPVCIIYYSKTKVVWFVLYLLISIAGIMLIIKAQTFLQYLMAFGTTLIGLFFSVFSYFDLLQLNKPQLTISHDGIQRQRSEIYRWNDIYQEQIIYQGRHRMPYLELHTSQGVRLFNIQSLSQSPAQILATVKQYKLSHNSLNW